MAKQVERFENWGYRVNPDSKGFLSHRYIDFAKWTDIHHSGTGRNPDVPINTFGVKDEHRNMLLIPRAYKQLARPRPEAEISEASTESTNRLVLGTRGATGPQGA